MKKILSTLLLGAMMLATLASCGGEDSGTTTTAAGAATTPAATTTKAPEGTTTTAATTEETEDPRYTPDTPMVDEEVAQWMTDHEAGYLNSKIDMDSLLTTCTSFFLDGPYENLFDSVFTQAEWAAAEAEGTLATQETPGLGKMGYGGSQATFYWGMTEPVTLGSYVIYTGNDNATYNHRLPVAWYILGSNTAPDPNALINGDPDALFAAGWVELDYVYYGNIADADAAPHGYKIDEANQGEYQYYCWLIEAGAYSLDADGMQVHNPDGDAVQVNGMKLFAAD